MTGSTTYDRDAWINRPQVEDTLITAPPGCGKTELLALRAASLVRSGVVTLPRQILAVTYSRKATANLTERLHGHLGPQASRHVVVTNFHRLGFRLIRYHGPLAGHMHSERALGLSAPLRRIRNEVAEQHNMSPWELSAQLRDGKCGAYSDAQVLDRLGPAALAYETRLRAEGRRDFDDAIRLGTLLLAMPSVSDAYRARFPVVMVDEAQDLAEAHLDMIDGIGVGRTTFAGDRAQGIYGFAGAAPSAVYERVEGRATALVRLDTSYRSAPAILRVVNWSSELLGGDILKPAPDRTWPHEGRVVVREFDHPKSEAEWATRKVANWLASDQQSSIGVMVRSGHRRRWLDSAIVSAGLPHELWDLPSHKPQLVNRFRRFVSSAIRISGDGVEGLNDLLLRCAESIDASDMETMDELNDSVDALEDAVRSVGLDAAIASIRVAGDPNVPAPPGLHLLNGHLGKGQQFDRVVVLGMEEGHIPDFRAKSSAEITEELSVLHVMTSRAQTELYFTRSVDVPYSDRPWIRQPSRWWGALRQYSTE
jgi:DNA helicase II / ATP-dependent DNA helicase PcrA